MDNNKITSIWVKLREISLEVIIIAVIAVLIILCILILIKLKKRNTSLQGAVIGFKGQYAGTVFPIKSDEMLVIGRDSAFSHIVFDRENVKISRRHCSIKYNATSKTYIVIDMSSNGTFIKQQRITPNQEVIVPSGTLISIGSKENVLKLT